MQPLVPASLHEGQGQMVVTAGCHQPDGSGLSWRDAVAGHREVSIEHVRSWLNALELHRKKETQNNKQTDNPPNFQRIKKRSGKGSGLQSSREEDLKIQAGVLPSCTG